MAFAPGQSGNPGGRSKESARIKALASSYAETAIRKLVKIMEESPDEKNALAAANALLDRGIGKPAQVHIGGDEDENPIAVSVIQIRAIDP
jgi:type IV pilus biogenesis protein CpaD/CtpE